MRSQPPSTPPYTPAVSTSEIPYRLFLVGGSSSSQPHPSQNQSLSSSLLHPHPHRHSPSPRRPPTNTRTSRSAPPDLNQLKNSQPRRRTPQRKRERRKRHVGLGGVAGRAAAEEQALQEDSQGDEAGEGEEGCCCVEGEGEVYFGGCKSVSVSFIFLWELRKGRGGKVRAYFAGGSAGEVLCSRAR
jgi:hypothetical protein